MSRARRWRHGAAALLLLALPGCATSISPGPSAYESTSTHRDLDSLPPPARPLVVAVYGYQDQTGQFQASQNVASYSHAVTQGAASVLIKALQDAGQGRWFTVLEREHLNNLVTERQIIREQRLNVKGPDGKELAPLPPMLYAGLLLEGGVIGYDSQTRTGGLGASYLGIGGNTQYSEDTVTVYLRAVSSQTGEVLSSVMVKKKIISYGLQGNVYKFVAYQKLLQVEAGFTVNEPGLVALRQAIEEAVIALVVQGNGKKLWQFADQPSGAAFVERWRDDQGADDIADPVGGRSTPAAASAASSAGGAAFSRRSPRKGCALTHSTSGFPDDLQPETRRIRHEVVSSRRCRHSRSDRRPRFRRRRLRQQRLYHAGSGQPQQLRPAGFGGQRQ